MLLLKLPLQRLKRLLHAAVAWQPLAGPGAVTAREMASMMRPPCSRTLAPLVSHWRERGAKVNRETVVKIITSWKLGHYIGTLKGLPLHDMAPVAGGVADREEDQLVLAASLLKRLLTPRIPGGGRGREGREREGGRERERGGEREREREREREKTSERERETERRAEEDQRERLSGSKRESGKGRESKGDQRLPKGPCL